MSSTKYIDEHLNFNIIVKGVNTRKLDKIFQDVEFKSLALGVINYLVDLGYDNTINRSIFIKIKRKYVNKKKMYYLKHRTANFENGVKEIDLGVVTNVIDILAHCILINLNGGTTEEYLNYLKQKNFLK